MIPSKCAEHSGVQKSFLTRVAFTRGLLTRVEAFQRSAQPRFVTLRLVKISKIFYSTRMTLRCAHSRVRFFFLLFSITVGCNGSPPYILLRDYVIPYILYGKSTARGHEKNFEKMLSGKTVARVCVGVITQLTNTHEIISHFVRIFHSGERVGELGRRVADTQTYAIKPKKTPVVLLSFAVSRGWVSGDLSTPHGHAMIPQPMCL